MSIFGKKEKKSLHLYLQIIIISSVDMAYGTENPNKIITPLGCFQ